MFLNSTFLRHHGWEVGGVEMASKYWWSRDGVKVFQL